MLFFGMCYYAFFYYYTNLQIADIREKVSVFEQMEEQVIDAKTPEESLGSFEYALFYYPSDSAYQIKGSKGELLLETLRYNSVCRMIRTLQQKYPEDKDKDTPIAWIKSYGTAWRVEGIEKDEWYRKWYMNK